METTVVRLRHVPYVVTNNRRMVVWSDVKEILLWCPEPKCSVVLNSLKMMLGYPALEAAMHPCSQLEQLLFLKHFIYITHGTLLVDLDSIGEAAKLTVLHNLVRQKHAKSKDPIINNCTKMLKTLTNKYANTSFKIPLNFAPSRQYLPAVRRMVRYKSATEFPTGELSGEKGWLKSVTGSDPWSANSRTFEVCYKSF